jgi:hypothetical protein
MLTGEQHIVKYDWFAMGWLGAVVTNHSSPKLLKDIDIRTSLYLYCLRHREPL